MLKANKPINLALGNDGFLLQREHRLNTQYLLEKERDLLVDLIRSGNAVEADIARFTVVDAQAEQLIRINESEFDLARFAVEYFSDEGNPDNDDNLIPKGVTYENMSQFHREFCEMLSGIASKEINENIARACPRSHAKTAYGSNITPIHQAVYRHRTFIVVISETVTVAGLFIQWGNRQLKFNQKLIDDFGVLLNERSANNEIDNKEEYVTLNNVKVMARGAGGQMRGMRFGSTRPQLMIFDDLEGEENVTTKEQRNKMRNWFNEEALPAMDKTSGIALYVGTILCYDSLLDYVIRKDKRFKSKRYKAVEKFADDTELWERWKKLYLEDDENSANKARRFYEKNEKAMLKGSKLLWGEYWTYYDFMEKLINMGVKSFTQEYQNEPTDEERQIFKVEDFYYYDENTLFQEDKFDFYCGIDFAMGKERGDFSSMVTLAKNKMTGVCYVVDVFNERVKPQDFIGAIIERVIRYEYSGIAIEAQMAQEFFADTLKERLIDIGYPAHTRMTPIKQRTKKQLRIEAMSPDIHNGNVRFKRSQTNILEQYERYPMVDHDDMIDAAEMAYGIAVKKSFGSIENIGNYYSGVNRRERHSMTRRYGRR